MKKRTKFILIGIVVVVVGLSAWKIVAGSSGANIRRQNIPIVKIESAQRETIVYALRFTGDVIPI